MPHRDLRQSLAMRSGYLACLFLVGSAMSGQSQSPQLLQVAECRTCAIQATKTASIGEAGGYELSLRPFGVTRAMDGTVWVLEQGKATPTVFNSRGRFLRDVGRSGGGPGEYEQVGNIVPEPDSLMHVLDQALNRRSILQSDGHFIRSVPLYGVGGALGGAVALPNGHFITNRSLTHESDVGYLFQEVDQAGKLLRQFGGDGSYRADRPFESIRRLGAAPNNSFWSAKLYEYRLQLYDSQRRVSLDLIRRADWFPTLARNAFPQGGRLDQPPTPEIKGIWQDANGLVWVVATLQSPQWKPTPLNGRPGQPFDTPLNEVLQTAIEVIDPATATVITSTRVRFATLWVLRNGYHASYRESSDGTPVVDIWHLTLTR